MAVGSTPNLIGASRTPAPLRGTQSLVGVMGFIWRHPSLTALELLWRWCAAAPLLYLLDRTLAPTLEAIPLDPAALGSMTFLEPVRSAQVLARQLLPYRSPLTETGKWWIPLALLVWTAAATLGRTAILRRAHRLQTQTSPPAPQTSRKLPAVALDTLLRALSFLIVIALWLLGLRAAVRATVTHPLYAGADPNLVLLTFFAVLLTLGAFFLWSTTVWARDLAPIRRLFPHALTPPQHRELRSKLMETNLVMGIVRVALLVLALTFSASPLPFQSRETQAYITVWWIGVGVLYVLLSDFFHVVRRVTYLRLLESIAGPANAARPPAS